MELKDLLTFAKAGYTPAQVKELLAIQTTVPAEQTIEETELQEREEKLQEPKEVIEEHEEPKTETVIKETEKQIDYKTLYEESQKRLQEAQSANINQNLAPLQEDNETIVTRMISSFL